MLYYINIYKDGTQKFFTDSDHAGYTACDHEDDGEELIYKHTLVRKDGVVIDNDFFGDE
jgi:hypothetical protein